MKWLNPIRWWRSVRRQLTAASVTLMLVGIISLNIVWGYPWVGMFACCFTLFFVGWILNQFAAPKLVASINAPRWVNAGQALTLPYRLTNLRRWPAMELFKIDEVNATEQEPIAAIPPNQSLTVRRDCQFGKRGLHPIPPLLIRSLFPFHLFRATRVIPSQLDIAVAPEPVNRDDDRLWNQLSRLLRGTASRGNVNDEVHYIGNREYREGIPVRRWDFAAWARLGRPILREFTSPATNRVRLILDTSRPASEPSTRQSDEDFERLLSLLCSTIELLKSQCIQIELHWYDTEGQSAMCEVGGDPSDLMVALAVVNLVKHPRRHADEDPLAVWWTTIGALPSTPSQIVFSLNESSPLDESMLASTHWVTARTLRTIGSEVTHA